MAQKHTRALAKSCHLPRCKRGEDDSSTSQASSSSTGITKDSLWTSSGSDKASLAWCLSVASIRRRAESGIVVNGSGVKLYVGQDILCNGNMFEGGTIIHFIHKLYVGQDILSTWNMFEGRTIIRFVHEDLLKVEVSWSGSLSWNGGWSNAIIDCSKLQQVILPDGTPCQQSQNSSGEGQR